MSQAHFRPDIHVRGWMTDPMKADLKGTEALVYAVIHQMTSAPNGEGCYYAGLAVLSGWVNDDRSRVRKILATLTKKGYIITRRRRVNKVERTTYAADLELAERWK